MSTYGQEPPADPWTDETQPVPPPAPAGFVPGRAPQYGASHVPPAAGYQAAQMPVPPAPMAPDPYAAGGYFPAQWQPPKQQKSTVVVVLITLLVVVVLASAGVSLYLFVFNKQNSAQQFVPKAGMCISVTTKNQIIQATCGAQGAYKVVQEITVPFASQAIAAQQCANVAGGNRIQAYYHVTQGTGYDYVVCLSTS